MGKLGDQLNKSIVPVALITSALAVVLGAVDSVTKIVNAAQSHFYVLMIACYVFCLFGLWPRKSKSKSKSQRVSPDARRNRILLVLVTIAFVGGVGHRYYDDHRYTRPAEQPATATAPRPPASGKPTDATNVNPGGEAPRPDQGASNPAAGTSVASPATAPVPASHLVLQAFTLNEEMSSFGESHTRLFAEGSRGYRTFAYDNDVSSAFREGSCAGPDGDQPIEDVLPLLKQRLAAKGQQALVRRIETVEALQTVMRDRGDLFARIVFSPAELRKLEKDSPSDYATVREWLLNCIGLQQPVLTLTILNDSNSPALLTRLVYHVEAVGGVRGGETGLVIPEHTYNHTLFHRVGRQAHALTPPLRIAAKESASFNLRLFPHDVEPGQAWLLRIEALAADGASVVTEPVQIIMSK